MTRNTILELLSPLHSKTGTESQLSISDSDPTGKELIEISCYWSRNLKSMKFCELLLYLPDKSGNKSTAPTDITTSLQLLSHVKSSQDSAKK